MPPAIEPSHGRDELDELIEQLRSEVAYLRERLVEAERGQAELRTLLNTEQQRIAALLAPPVDTVTTAPEPPEKAIAAEALVIETPPLTVQALKQAGVRGKKQRRKLLDRLAPLWRH